MLEYLLELSRYCAVGRDGMWQLIGELLVGVPFPVGY